jgi:hypothetical protein
MDLPCAIQITIAEEKKIAECCGFSGCYRFGTAALRVNSVRVRAGRVSAGKVRWFLQCSIKESRRLSLVSGRFALITQKVEVRRYQGG